MPWAVIGVRDDGNTFIRYEEDTMQFTVYDSRTLNVVQTCFLQQEYEGSPYGYLSSDGRYMIVVASVENPPR